MMSSIPQYEQETDYDKYSDFHSVFTIQMGELIRDGLINFKDGTWDTQISGATIQWYNDEQKERFWDKFANYYYYREIGELPYLQWKARLLSKIALLMPKYNILYDLLDKGVDVFQEYDEYGKSRDIYSDFPQTMLSGNEDYASTGNDSEFEKIKQGDFLEKMKELMDSYNDPDYALVRELDTHFYTMLTSNMNGF